MVGKIFDITVYFMLFFSGVVPQCEECLERDTIPYKKIERAVSAPLDSVRDAKLKELDSVLVEHDKAKRTLDSLTDRKFIGRIDSFRAVNKKYNKVFWWYRMDKWGNINYSHITSE